MANIFDYLGGVWGNIVKVPSDVLNFILMLIFGISNIFFYFLDYTLNLLGFMALLIDIWFYIFVVCLLHAPSFFMIYEMCLMIYITSKYNDGFGIIINFVKGQAIIFIILYHVTILSLYMSRYLIRITYELVCKVIKLLPFT